MAKHRHTVRCDLVHEQLGAVTALGERKIPTAMTWPVAQIKSALRQQAEAIDDARQILLDSWTEGEWKDGKTAGEKRKFIPAPVYATNEDGSTKYKLDTKGVATTEREIAQGKVQLINAVQYNRELRELNRGVCEIEIPHLSWVQLEGKVPSLEANIIAPLMDYFDDPPKDIPDKPAGKAAKKGAESAPAEAAAT